MLTTDNRQLMERFLQEKPNFHAWSSGEAWMLFPEVLNYIFSHVQPSMNTLETGAGHSTVVFALSGATHVCVTPSLDESQRILQYCEMLNVDGRLTFVHESSDTALACNKAIPDTLDFVLIDGAHRFPFPYIDFHYTEKRLQVGGILGLDDVKIPSVQILYNFLCQEPNWELAANFGKTVFFKKLGDAQLLDDWQGQKLNRNSIYYRRVQLSQFVQRLFS